MGLNPIADLLANEGLAMPPWRPIPQATRTAVLERCRNRCEDCRVDYGDNGRALEFHHRRYLIDDPNAPLRKRPKSPYGKDQGFTRSKAIFGCERPQDVVALCRGCHYAWHHDPNGEFWLDPEDKEDFWESYFWELHDDDVYLGPARRIAEELEPVSHYSFK